MFPFESKAWSDEDPRLVFLQTLASNLFASSIIPYAGFLYHLQRSKKAPKLTLFGFYFLLVFVFSTIVAGITGKSLPKAIVIVSDPQTLLGQFLIISMRMIVAVQLSWTIQALYTRVKE